MPSRARTGRTRGTSAPELQVLLPGEPPLDVLVAPQPLPARHDALSGPPSPRRNRLLARMRPRGFVCALRFLRDVACQELCTVVRHARSTPRPRPGRGVPGLDRGTGLLRARTGSKRGSKTLNSPFGSGRVPPLISAAFRVLRTARSRKTSAEKLWFARPRRHGGEGPLAERQQKNGSGLLTSVSPFLISVCSALRRERPKDPGMKFVLVTTNKTSKSP
jgi:hypothetical protein